MSRIASLVTLFRRRRQRTRERREAARFSDRELWDVGLTRADIHREFARPFWRGDGTEARSHDNVRPAPIGAMTCSQPMKAAATAAR